MKNSINKIKLGELSLKNNLFLAPMLGFTNFAFRELIQKTSNISTITEMIPINALSKDCNYCKDLIIRGNYEKNLGYQFFGNDENKFVKSIENLEKMDIKIDYINLNCGCPATDIIKQGAGSALLNRESKIKNIIEKTKECFDYPFTIKIRTGYDYEKHLNYKELEGSGLDAIFLHGRTKKQQYSGEINLEYIKEVKEKTNIPIIANGDIRNIEDINRIYEYTKCDGFMIGRKALFNPFIFEEILYKNKKKFEDKIFFLEEYYKLLEFKDVKTKFKDVKNLSLFFARNIDNIAEVRKNLAKSQRFDEIIGILKKVC